MQISTMARYGLRAMIRLAALTQNSEEVVSVKKISELENISNKYLEAIFAMLKKNNLVSSVKGKNGGYKLQKPSEKITALKIVEVLDGNIATVNCVFDKKHCTSHSASCVVRPLWRELNESIKKVLKDKSVKYFSNKLQRTSGKSAKKSSPK